MKDNLMTDPIFPVRTANGVRSLSLPGVLAALHADEVDDFPFLRPHHRHPWHAFLCQLAVMALEEGGGTFDTPYDENSWRDLLRGLTPDFPDDEPWRLVVSDLSKPAFMQPPVPEGDCSLWNIVHADSEVDVIPFSKQFGEKSKEFNGVAEKISSLIVQQTQADFSAAGRNGSYQSTIRQAGIPFNKYKVVARPCVSVVVNGRYGLTWNRDSNIIIKSINNIREVFPYSEGVGLRLLWTLPWSGYKKESLSMQRLHPLFIEVCRRIRIFRSEGGELNFYRTGTKGVRIDGKEYKGAIGDPWIPVRISENSVTAFRVKPNYISMSEVLFNTSLYIPSTLQELYESDPNSGIEILFRVLVRSHGGVDGYYERSVPISKRERKIFRRFKDKAAELSEFMIKKGSLAEKEILKISLLHVVQPENDELDFKQKDTCSWANKYSKKLDIIIDTNFFYYLWICLEKRGENKLNSKHIKPWSIFLANEVRAIFYNACNAMPVISSLRYRAQAKGENMLEALIRKHLSVEE